MKKITLFLLCFFIYSDAAFSQDVDSIFIEKTKLYFHIARAKANQSLVIHLHGAVSQFKNLEKNKISNLDSLLENNSDFIHEFTKAGFDVLVPQAFNEFNWLEEKGKIYVEKLIEKYGQRYNSIFISGFSDGGTGAYRIFYQNPEKFTGVIMFNAYPQLQYFNKTIDYKKITNKKVIYFTQKNDHLIPYEFPLLEYRRQKIVNSETYFYIKDGKHEFYKYTKNDFLACIKNLQNPILPKENKEGFFWIYPPIDGLIIDDKIVELYTFQKAVAKKFGIDIKEYMSQVDSKKTIEKFLKENEIVKVAPTILSSQELETMEMFEFTFIVDKKTYLLYFDNYFKMSNW